MITRVVLAALLLCGCARPQANIPLPPGRVVTFYVNPLYDGEGDPDTRPGTWGNAGFVDAHFPFKQVPPGYRVRITRIHGTFYGYPRGTVKLGTAAGVMFGMMRTSAGATPFVDTLLAGTGCFVWITSATTGGPFTVSVDYDPVIDGVLDDDNVLIMRSAVFINETGQRIHMEFTGALEAMYEKKVP